MKQKTKMKENRRKTYQKHKTKLFKKKKKCWKNTFFYYKVVKLHLEKKNHALAPTCNIHKGRKWGKYQPQKEGKHHEQKHRGSNDGTWSIGQKMAWEMPISITQIAP